MRAETLPFENASFDTVVSTLVFCTVDDPVQSLKEVHRILRPGGALIFIEHVHAHDNPGRAAGSAASSRSGKPLRVDVILPAILWP